MTISIVSAQAFSCSLHLHLLILLYTSLVKYFHWPDKPIEPQREISIPGRKFIEGSCQSQTPSNPVRDCVEAIVPLAFLLPRLIMLNGKLKNGFEKPMSRG